MLAWMRGHLPRARQALFGHRYPGAGPLDYLNAFDKLCTKDARRLVAVHLRLSRCTFSRLAVEEGRTDNRRDRYDDLRLYNHNTRTAYRGERTLTVVRSFVQISSKDGDEWRPVMEILSSNEMAECFVHALYDVQSLRTPVRVHASDLSHMTNGHISAPDASLQGFILVRDGDVDIMLA
jgi:hypothetical protein